MGVLGQKSPTAILYATQLAFLKDQTGAVYYYNSPTNNGACIGWDGVAAAHAGRHRVAPDMLPAG